MNRFLKVSLECIRQNKLLFEKKLVLQNFGNVSLRFDKDHFIIKPSGANLDLLEPKDMPVIKISTQKKISGRLKPSTDTATHLEIYKKYDDLYSICHNHSVYATGWAQSSKPIPLLGTTHADYWKTDIPIVDYLSSKLIKKNYEKYTGKLILKTLKFKKLTPYDCPGVIVSGHGPFTWGKNFNSSVINAEIMEFIAKTSFISTIIKVKNKLPKYISQKHYNRKHGKKSYYGQK